MAQDALGGRDRKIASALHSEATEVPVRVVVLLWVRSRGVQEIFSQPTYGDRRRAVRLLSRAGARLWEDTAKRAKGRTARAQVQAQMTDGRRVIVLEQHLTRDEIIWKAGELWASLTGPPTS